MRHAFSHICLLLAQLRVLALVFMDDGVNDLIEEGLIHAQKLAVAGSPAEQAAEHRAMGRSRP